MRLDHLLSMENVVEVERHFTVFDERIPRKTVVQFSGMDAKRQLTVGVSNGEGPPVPIPNTEVKLTSVDNTLRATVREDRSTPTRGPLITGGSRPLWGCSSAGRAPALQAGGHGFESHHLHHGESPCREKGTAKADTSGYESEQRYRLIAQQVRARA